jgi:hypothetical protein
MARRLFFVLRLAAIPVLAALTAMMEARQPFAMFRLVTFGAVFFLLVDIASLLRSGWRDCLIVFASLAFGMFLAEAVATAWEPRPATVNWSEGLYASRPVLGLGPIHAGRFHAEKRNPKTGAIIYSADYTIDSNLLRHTQSCETGPPIVFLGCSWTFGVGLNDADTLPQVFADSLNRKVPVLNLGFGGYGPQQFLSELQSGMFDSAIGPAPRLFVFVTAAWQADRSACKAYWLRYGPRYELEKGQLILKGACYEGLGLWMQEWLHKSAAYRWLIEPYRNRVSRDDVELYIQITSAAIKLAKAKYGAPVIVLYPSSERENQLYLRATGVSAESVRQRLRDAGATVIDASLLREWAAGMALSIPGDGHPTALANRLRVTLLKEYIEQNLPGVLASRQN